ncbi:MAG: DUF4382 domain-containing protein [Desulfobacterales bacterium]|nr:MAG: DUF4382 domain-containing protein [Desulfobacterales bacterium]
MNRILKSAGSIFSITLIAAALILGGCSGGGGGADAVGSAATDTGTVALSLTDGPTDDYESIIMYVKRAFLLPTDGGAPVPIFDSKDPDGYPVDLLDLREREDEFLLSIKKWVPAKRYSKIRLEIVDIEVFGEGICAKENQIIKLPSEKIDLNPRSGPFWLRKGETLAIKLDIDAEKSFDLHAAGKSDQCIFRPVVFVDVEKVQKPQQRCPLILAGEIAELLKQDDANPNDVTGFSMLLKERWYADPYDDRGQIEVKFESEAKIFDMDGDPILPNDLANPDKANIPGQKVLVRGRLDEQGKINASLVVLGAVDMKKGLAAPPSTEEGFLLDLDHDLGLLNIDLTGDPLFLTDCDTLFDGMVVPVGARVRVFGKYVSDKFRAFVVLVKKQNLTGTLTRIDGPEGGGYNLFLEGFTDPIFLLEDAPVSVEGVNGSDLDIVQLQDWVDCKPRKVEIIASNTVPNQADALLVYQETLVTTATGTNPADGTINYTDNGMEKKILVAEGARIYRFMEGWGNNPDYLDPNIDVKEIQPGDRIIAYGLAACPDDVAGIGLIDFYAYSVFVWPDVADYKWKYYDGSYADDDDGDGDDDDDDDKVKKEKKDKNKK